MKRTETPLSPFDVVRLLGTYPLRWIGPAVGVILLAATFTLLWPRSWVATQGLIVRDEATTAERGAPGTFLVENEMKVTLETILEITKSRGVLESALREVGPPPDCDGWLGSERSDAPNAGRSGGSLRSTPATQPFPTAEDIADLHDAIKLSPPKGAEYGSTEVVYLQVKDRNRSRALALAAALCNHLEDRLQEIREQKADSVVAELENAVRLAERDLSDSTTQLREIEKQVGSDLVELRILHRSASDTSDLRRKIVEVAGELRRSEIQRRNDEQLLELLQETKDDPTNLLAAPNELLAAQPLLRRLKDGLVDAQLQTSQLRGRFTDEHPRVRAARNAEREIQQQIHGEIDSAVRGIQASLKLATGRGDLLRTQLEGLERRLERLAGLRADYSNLVADVENQSRLLADAREELMTARAERAGAVTSSLLSRIDNPNTGTKPAGPGHAMVLLAGAVGGLIIGIGVLLLSVEPAQPDRRGIQPESGSPAYPRSNGNGRQSVPSFPRTPETVITPT